MIWGRGRFPNTYYVYEPYNDGGYGRYSYDKLFSCEDGLRYGEYSSNNQYLTLNPKPYHGLLNIEPQQDITQIVKCMDAYNKHREIVNSLREVQQIRV